MWSALEPAAGSADLWFTQFCSSWFVCVCVCVCVCVLWRWGSCMFSICSFNFHSISFPVWLHTFTILDRLCHLQLCWKRRIEVEAETVYLWSLKLHLMSLSSLQPTTEEDTFPPIIREGNQIWCWKCKDALFINPDWHWRSYVWGHLQVEVKINRLRYVQNILCTTIFCTLK